MPKLGYKQTSEAHKGKVGSRKHPMADVFQGFIESGQG